MPARNGKIIQCLYCSGSVYKTPSRNRKKFCSNSCHSKYKIQIGLHPTKGKKHSEETKEKIRQAHLKIKGGITSLNNLERLKFKREVQKLVLERDDYTCQLCDERGGKLQVDHIQPWAEYVELRFDIQNCRTLCMACHYKITFGRELPEGVTTWGHNLTQKEG